MNAEEFILIPKNQYMRDRPIVDQLINDPAIKAKSKQLSVLQRYIPSFLPQETTTTAAQSFDDNQ